MPDKFFKNIPKFGKLNFGTANSNFKLKPIFATAPAASKNDVCYKSGQNWLESNISLLWSKSAKQTVVFDRSTDEIGSRNLSRVAH